ncbi:hypothetical protein ANN_07921 [Periplaneta americana]|uniref:Peptidase S1 domain-containing protein n=1 Tax=Periplaneta americana TaxID=6978 RepID=A0ABQ8T0M6_PERAM|nr:hypothetical protein ANN_07921 [Periplaneta americana]
MSPGSSTDSYPAFAHIGLRENPGKNLNQVTCPDRESNPGHLVSQPDALTVTPQTFEMDRAARMGESTNAYRVLVGRPEGKRPLGWPRRRWEDNIKMYLREVGYDDRDWINLDLDREQWRAYVRAINLLKSSLKARKYSAYCMCERPKTTFTKLEQRSWIKIEVTRGRSAKECFHGLHEAYADAALPYRTVEGWVIAFREGRDVKVMFIVAYDIDELSIQLKPKDKLVHDCGASIIGEKWAISAAHCAEGLPLDLMSLRAGSTYASKGGSLHKVKKIYMNNYDPDNYENDICLLEVSLLRVFFSY